MRVRFCYVLIAFSSLCCTKFTDGTSRLRVENTSVHRYSELTAHGSDFGKLDPGARSQYVLVQDLFGSISISLRADTTELSSIVIDHVGEEPLRPGDFTLQVNVSGDLNRGATLTQNLIRD